MPSTNASSLAPLFAGAGIVSVGILLVGLAASILGSEFRFWPHGDRDWTFWMGWVCWTLYFLSFLLVSYLDAGGLFAPGSIALAVGSVLIVAGSAVAVFAALQVGLTTSTGVSAELYTDGLYRYSRNPQYVGFVTAIVGVILCSGSGYALLLGLLGVVWFLVAPLAEEPWLEAEYGAPYVAYRKRTPRFIGISRPDDRDE